MANKYKQIHDALAPLLSEMQDLLGSEYKVTFIGRNCERNEADVILGDDVEYRDVIAVLDKYKDEPPKIAYGEPVQ